jgi:hypothetical protein
MDIEELRTVYTAAHAASAGLLGILNRPSSKGHFEENEMERFHLIMSAVAAEIECRPLSTSHEAELAFEVLVSFWGRDCGEYAKATEIAVRLLPLIVAPPRAIQ